MSKNMEKGYSPILFVSYGKRCPGLKNSLGLTIVELVVVLAVLVILSSIAVPNINGWLPKYRLKSAVNDLVSNLQLTKLNAVKENKEWAVVFDSGGSRYALCSGSGADNVWATLNDNPKEKIVQFSEYKSGVGYGHGAATTSATGGSFPGDDIDYTGNAIIYNSQGICNNGFAYMTNGNNDASYAVGTTVAGGIVIRKWTGAAWD